MSKIGYLITAVVIAIIAGAAAYLLTTPPAATPTLPATTPKAAQTPTATATTTQTTQTTTTTQKVVLYMATTTSVKDTGLLDVLIPDFEKWARSRGYDIEVRYTAVGTGQALLMAARGDVDVVIVHAPSLEKQYLENGTLKCRDVIAYNFFIIVGPKDDPAGARGLTAVEAFRKIAEAKAPFVSRGDRSGTHLMELSLWKKAIGREPDPAKDTWYISAGAGMGQTLLLANEKKAYTLSDTGTWLRYRDKLPQLDVIVAAAPDLINIYSFEIVKPSPATKLMAQYMLTRGLEVIGNLTIAGTPLFTPINKADPKAMEWIKPAIFGPSCVS
ncbi:substrate-binding domain-containing protein [Pyrobaculum sp. 3827-6]|uniref:substrate-binding domain-containing protein n=1 Tax=Pyrobaculum sp. 3827-6 TaxID=2983604 RepID=UPI0021D844E3|nr:substrate-binding domain-containing protein [Pyrobaculum sp. 3827-6]MCU7786855.1 substrate-binding domain-containing protein [Pyrobaculum sp. 3827-6]